MKKVAATIALLSALASPALAQTRQELEQQVNQEWSQVTQCVALPSEEVEKEASKWDPAIASELAKIQFAPTQRRDINAAYDEDEHAIKLPYRQYTIDDLTFRMALSWRAAVGKEPSKLLSKQALQFNTELLNGATQPSWSVLSESILSMFKKDFERFRNNNTDFLNRVKDAVDHEMTHALLDSDKGLMLLDNFARPSYQQAQNYTMLRLANNGEAMQQVFSDYLGAHWQDITEKYKQLDRFILKDFSSDRERFASYDAIYESVMAGDYEPPYVVWANEKFRPDPDKNIPAADAVYLRSMRNMDFNNVLERYLVYERTFGSDELRIEQFVFKERPYLRLERSKNHFLIKFDPNRKKLFDAGIPAIDLPEFMQYKNHSTLQRTLIRETHARMVDSLMSIELTTENNSWRLDQNDLNYLSQFTLDGHPIFKNGIEKYKIALELEAEGMPQSEIRDTLEHATSYSRGGKMYDWPRSEVKISYQGCAK